MNESIFETAILLAIIPLAILAARLIYDAIQDETAHEKAIKALDYRNKAFKGLIFEDRWGKMKELSPFTVQPVKGSWK